MRKRMFYGASKIIFQNAKRLRNEVTNAEMIFWAELRRCFPSLRFRRQHPMSDYVADFYCHKLKLVIEIDGSIHELETVQKNDQEKESHFISLGLTVMRFTNDDIKHRIDACIDEIRKLAAANNKNLQ